MLRSIVKHLGSLKLALFLLGVIIIASAYGTYFESKFTADVAREWIYNAWWFNAWMVLLCINLFCAAAIRYPWKPHQTGFVITHAGIITMLIGGMIDRHWGIEGFLALTRGRPATNVMELHEQEVVVYANDGGQLRELGRRALNMKVLLPAADDRRTFAVPTNDADVRVLVKDAANVEPYRDVVKTEGGKPAVLVTLRGPMMGVHEQWLLEDDHINMGPATLGLHTGMPEEPEAEQMVPRLERHFIFEKRDEPIARAIYGDETGAKSKLVLKDGEPELQLEIFDKKFTIPVKEHIKKDYPLPGIDGWKALIVGYFPNFRMKDREPVTVDDKPENPALMLELYGPLVKKGEPPDHSDDPHGGGGHAGHGGKRNSLELYLGGDGVIRYVVKSRKHEEKRGETALDKAVSLSWAPGAEFVVTKIESSVKSQIAYRPMTKQPGSMDGGTPGLLCQVAVGKESKEVWIGQKNLTAAHKYPNGPTGPITIEPIREPIVVGGKTIELAFNNRWVHLPFKVSLLKFHAPMDEGDDSTTFMAFESTLSFEHKADRVELKANAAALKELDIGAGHSGTMQLDGAITDLGETGLTFELPDRRSVRIPFSDIASYDKQTHKIYMNSPTTYPESWHAPWFGTSYKFSQAGHEMPANPDYSGVQVLRDPGWFFKWIGALGICFGIFTMFYLKPYFHRKPAVAAAPAKNERKAGALNKSKTEMAAGE